MTDGMTKPSRWRARMAALAIGTALPLAGFASSTPAHAGGPSTMCAALGIDYGNLKETLPRTCGTILCAATCHDLPLNKLLFQ
jgi:hypothetical protein